MLLVTRSISMYRHNKRPQVSVNEGNEHRDDRLINAWMKRWMAKRRTNSDWKEETWSWLECSVQQLRDFRMFETFKSISACVKEPLCKFEACARLRFVTMMKNSETQRGVYIRLCECDEKNVHAYFCLCEHFCTLWGFLHPTQACLLKVFPTELILIENIFKSNNMKVTSVLASKASSSPLQLALLAAKLILERIVRSSWLIQSEQVTAQQVGVSLKLTLFMDLHRYWH